MAKFKIHGSGGEGKGAGWINKVYFATADEVFVTDDADMIAILRQGNMATEIIDMPAIKTEVDTTKIEDKDPVADLYKQSHGDLVDICKEMQIEPKRAKQDMIDAIIAELKGQG